MPKRHDELHFAPILRGGGRFVAAISLVRAIFLRGFCERPPAGRGAIENS
jgi:hypothetical protein